MQAKAIINISKKIIIIKQNNDTDVIPITCFSKIDPKVFTPIDFVKKEYNKLELEEIYKNPQHYLNVFFNNNMTTINSQQYLTEFSEFSKLELLRTDKHWKGPEKCLYKILSKEEDCLYYNVLYQNLQEY
ncbi:13521_t:CDS:1 [Funneliformis caledonium]|uniref:13521_t:CDS:1 n=1 Tax=Funneliformis caledonium TaxID=1117310 RepID=A0A9N9H4W4_9GLOM|nr:13521_t:CDS:1 [Funneliformis caledonium]